ncbi:MAG: ComF family protein [Candidatus Gottesmanbacteria bacterium]|nr:ComF family protein [Candidatus Gottesmanbacteria bacterium]
MNLLDFIFPKRCVGCGKIGKYFCAACRANIRVIKPNEPICPMCGRPALDGATHPICRTRYSLDGLTSFFHYDGPVRKAIKAIKYRLVSDLAEEFVNLVSVRDFDDCILIPIPLHPSRFRQRGFNQAEVLGSILAKRLNVAVRTDILRRVKETEPQVSIKKRADRLENMKNIFSCKNITGNILLFDDVCTTGATMRSAATVLKRAGATCVWAVSMAR